MVAVTKLENLGVMCKISQTVVKIGKKIVLPQKHIKRVIFQWLHTKTIFLMVFLRDNGYVNLYQTF